jgi:hypothetical protein
MDDFFQILIFIIIIISFLSSIFKKKEKQIPVPPVKQKPDISSNDNEDYNTGVKTKEDEYEIFREISDLFKTDIPQRTQTGQKPIKIRERTQNENLPSSSEHVSTEYGKTTSEHASYETDLSSTEHDRTYSEHTIDPSWHKPKDWAKEKKRKVEPAIEKQAEEFRKLLEERKSEENIYKSKIKERLKNPQSLKEYVLISEILGKPVCRTGRPKAWRR